MPYWIIFFLGIIFLTFDKYSVLGYLTLNFISLLFFIRVGIILHESGHLFFAKMVGGCPKRMVLGYGHEIVRFNVGNVKVILNSSLKGGLAISNFSSWKYLKWKKAINIFGGPFTNLLVATICFYCFGFNRLILTAEFGLDLSSSFIVANLLICCFSLLPYRLNYNGIKVPTDGLNLLILLFQKNKNLDQYINEDEFFKGYELFEGKEYDKAINIFSRYQEFKSTRLVSKINLSVMYLKKGAFEKAFVLLQDCLKLLETEKKNSYTAFVNNNIAWIYLLKKDYKNASRHAKIANLINNRESIFIGTRGSCLIEIGSLDLGINLLKTIVNLNYTNSQSLCAAMYLSYGYFLKNNLKKHKKYLDFVMDNRSKLDLDEVQILQNILERIT